MVSNIEKTFKIELKNDNYILFRYATGGGEQGFHIKNNKFSIKLPISMFQLKELAEFILKL